MDDTELGEQCYYQYKRARRLWRRWSSKPVRCFRRNFMFNQRRKGKGKGKRNRFFLRSPPGEAFAYLKGKGKQGRSHTSGNGFGRKGNPNDKQGKDMKCRVCGGEEHFARECPQNQNKGGGKGSGFSVTSFTHQSHHAGRAREPPSLGVGLSGEPGALWSDRDLLALEGQAQGQPPGQGSSVQRQTRGQATFCFADVSRRAGTVTYFHEF